MNITEKLLEVSDKVLDEKEKEVVFSYLDNADEIDFNDFWRSKNYEVIAKKGLTTYHKKPIETIEDTYGHASIDHHLWKYKTLEPGFRAVSRVTVYERLKSAFEKLEKSPELRAIGYTL